MQLVYLMKVQGRGNKKKKKGSDYPEARKEEETRLGSGYYFAMNRDHHMERPL